METSIAMAGDGSSVTVQAIQSLLHDVAQTSATGFNGRFKKDCTDLSRRVSLLSHLFEEIWDSQGVSLLSHSSSLSPPLSQLMAALKAATKLLQSAGGSDRIISHESAMVEFTSEFRRVTCKLEKALAYFPYGYYEISVDVKEQVDFVRGQLIRAVQQYGIINVNHHRVESKVNDLTTDNLPLKAIDEVEDSVIPDDFLCPISRELFRDPVILSTGQTYERSYIERWIKSGYKTCPKSCQKIGNLTLTPNYVLRSLIAQWCTDHNVEQPTLPKKIEPVCGKPRKKKCQTVFMMKFAFFLVLLAAYLGVCYIVWKVQ